MRKGYRSAAESAGIKSASLITEDSENSFALMTLKEGDEVTLHSVKVRKNVTNPPERYTDATLLSAMEHAGRFVDDDKLKANLGNGLGTPATRADMIEKLIQNRYVEREGKYFIPTAKGREVVRLAPEVLRSPELTGVWEGRLEKIAKGKEDPDAFIRDIKKMASDLVREVERSDKVFSPKFKDTKKLSCQYEEKEVKVKVSTGASPEKKFSTDASGKVRVVITKKSSVKIPKAVYETSQNRFSSSDFGGGTMADFFRISQERNKERSSKRK